MKKRIPVIIGIIITVALAVLYGFTKKTHKIYDNNVNTATYQSVGILQEQEVIQQTFVCAEEKLDGFMIKCDVSGNYGIATVSVKVRDPETGDILAEGQETGENIRARKLHYYKIEPLTGYKGKTLLLEVSEENTSDGNGILFSIQPNTQTEYPVIVAGNSPGGVLVMKTVTERFDVETFAIMLFCEWFIWGFLWFLYRLFK